MARIHTHYDNLKVTRNAPPEVIRAAYKTLCQKFHPDRNPGNENAKNTFLMIRMAYETLSDPEKRKLHDAWIAATESAANSEDTALKAIQKLENRRPRNARARTLRTKKRGWQLGFWLLIGSFLLTGFLFY